MKQKKIYIVSSDDIVLYQPTILNLYDYLKVHFDLEIITFEPNYLGKQKDQTRNIEYISFNGSKRKLFRLFDLLTNAVLKKANKISTFFNFRSELVRSYKTDLLKNVLKNINNQIIIAVDFMPLYVAQQTNNKICFLSLEIYPNDRYLKLIDVYKIEFVIIQNIDRYNYLFQIHKPLFFLIQNSPFLKYKVFNRHQRNGLIWAGTITKEFGVFNCLNFIRKYPEYNLTLKGGLQSSTKKYINREYKDLFKYNLIKLNSTYLNTADFILFISKFKIGFCFYDWDLIKSNFNYQTAPSGKLFMYLAAGVPVIACNVIGFKFIETYDAGVLINDYMPETIYKAIKKIESNYEFYSANAYKVFDKTCFDINLSELLSHLTTL